MVIIKYSISTFVCEKCRLKMFLPRKKKRKKNHIKDIYCVNCREIQKFKEIGEYKE